ncbi:Coronin-1C [Bonamia ostreae]|uniref:Coronin n=1 Tax=Bonamia ostreae TaxID=126728 RepID=A0ABV2AP07_9EUKA
MATLPRESKYRHIFHETATNTNCYTDINPDVFGDSQHIATNGKYWAVPIQAGGGGSFMVHNLEDTGRIQREHPLFKYHTARILELSFSKFNDNIIASSSDDCSVRVCNFPEEMTDNIMKEDVLLNGHSKKVTDLSWHNTANNVLASSSADKKVIIWDVEVGEEAIVIEDHEDLVYSIVWNDNGRYFGSSCQDRLIRILDPRDENASVLSTIGHENKKMSRVFWLNNRNMIGSVGFTKDSYRELAFFDLRKIEEAFLKKRLDRQTSKFFPYFEEGNDILFLSGFY